MKKITYIFGLLLVSLMITSCSEDFLDTKPLDEFSEVDVWNDSKLIETFVNNYYRQLGYGFDIDMLACYVDEAHFTPGWGVPDFNKSLMTSDKIYGWAENWFGSNTDHKLWSPLYKAIRATNIFLSKIDESAVDEADKARLTGETYFWRAFYYHYLTSLYGGVPIIEQAYGLSDEFEIVRSSYADCIDFIVADLDKAAGMLPDSHNEADDIGRATKGAALALKSRVLLYAASDLHNTNMFSSFSNPELLQYASGSQSERWTKAKNAAKAVIDLGTYSLFSPDPASHEEATQNYIAYFTSYSDPEDIFVRFFTPKINEHWSDYFPGKHSGPNGYHNWGNNCPLGNLVDDYEMADGTAFSWENPDHKADPYGRFGGEKRDPRFYADILYDGAQWRQRPSDAASIDPLGIIQTGSWDLPDGTQRHGLDTRKGPIEDWNGGYTGYYVRKFIVQEIDAQYTNQDVPWRYMRLGEVYLNYVEACIELGEEAEARTYLNKIRKRAAMPDITVSGSALKEAYRHERRIEMAYEESRFYDVRRWALGEVGYADAEKVDILYPLVNGATATQPVYTPSVFEERTWDNKAYFFPIMRDEMNKNSLLVQNPGY